MSRSRCAQGQITTITAQATGKAGSSLNVRLNEISADEREMFVQATRPVYQHFESSIGEDVIEQAIRELGPA